MNIRFVSRQEIVNTILDKLIERGNLTSEQQDLLVGLTSGKQD
jgi:hypothetical protein